MREIILITFGCATTVILLWCMFQFVYHALCNSDWLATVFETEGKYSYSLITKINIFVAAIGFLGCLWFGTDGFFWWMPSTWGGLNENGRFVPLRETLSCIAAFHLGLPLIVLIVRGISNTATTKRLETRLHAAESSAVELSRQLETNKAIIESLREQIESLRSKSDR